MPHFKIIFIVFKISYFLKNTHTLARLHFHLPELTGKDRKMAQQLKNKKGISSGMKKTIAIGCGILLALGILFFSERVTTINKGNPDFSYTLRDNEKGLVQLTSGEKVEVPFEFRFDEGTSRINFELAGGHIDVAGIAFSNSNVAVEEGKAQGKVIFQIASEEDLKAGSHVLTIIAKDADSGAVVRKGEMMINFNMLKVIAGCSC